MAVETLQTQTLIKGLKYSIDSEGLPKIVWARQIRVATTPSLPNKDEIIVEWIFNSMLSSKSDDIR